MKKEYAERDVQALEREMGVAAGCVDKELEDYAARSSSEKG
jgi:hypothetical protein